MKRLVGSLLVFAFCGALAGCGSSHTEDTINKVLNQVNEASNRLAAVRSELEKAVKKAEDNKKKITLADLNEAIKETKNLRKVGQELLTLKSDADALKAKVGPDRKEALAQEYGEKLKDAYARLEKSTEDLERSVTKVDGLKDEQKTIDALRTAIRESKQEFEALTRRN